MRLIYRIKQLLLATGDFLCFTLGFWLSLWLRYLKIPQWEQIERHLSLFFLLFIFWIIIIFINGLYDLAHLRQEKYKRHFIETALLSLFLSTIFFYLLPKQNITPKTILLLNILLGFILSFIWRLIYNKYLNNDTLKTNIIFIGYTPESTELIKILENYPERGYRITALIDLENKNLANKYSFFNTYNSLQNIEKIATALKTNTFIIASHLKKDEEISKNLFNLFFSSKLNIIDLDSFYEVITGRIPPTIFSEAWFLENLKTNEQLFYNKIKNLLDRLIGLIIFGVLIIIFPIFALILKLTSPGPIFYKQIRVGKNGKEFTIYKLRSMYALTADGGAEQNGYQFATKNDKRITPFGKFLRKTRIDELPQCINLLKGELTLIGPRPERPEIVAEMVKIMPYYPLRHIVKPGLTGWAAINQNYTDTLETTLQKLQYDIFYIKNQSPLLDLVIILRTINLVLRMKGQ
ncbi:MAG: sugar transferase [Candidatus Magasanikbacteria bacterium GW2011_GWC2_37_14]|uniref:Sugar transferase n=1 Tax=Candidatus Magasanikbacteria bacterium GW2011_GWC2_37_14 TaxID=1619046 RepID=A0A0G0GNI5_9BACT|nr:MAG: sugar transferase [Candidatus Magasanikbacteria bacterium GW2011_GWC2_37_14]